MLIKDQEGGLRGNPRRGFPLLFILALSTCAPFYWEVVATPCCHSTPFLWCLPKETVSSRQRKALFYPGGSTIRVSASASVVVTHPSPTWGGAGGLTGRSSQPDAGGGYVGATSPWERRAGPNSSRGGTHKRVSLGLHPVSLRKSKEMGWNGQQGAAASDQGNGAPAQPPDKHQPPPQVGRGTSRLPTGSAHANGGATGVKKRFSLAARHRFFGQAPKKWGRIAGQAIDHLPTYRRTRRKPKTRRHLICALYVCAVSLGSSLYPLLPFDPISLVLAQRNGVEPPKKSAFFTPAAPPFA